ncbi:MAG: leucine-rich repeat domain-containing protein [Eubacterium sp.]|nr:leucine-rich repeat domain-containing protein [Eubacterium sp.]
MKHIILTALFSLCLTFFLAPPVKAVEVAETGICGETAQWFLYDDGTMVIRGTGAIGTSGRLVRASKEDVKRVVVEGGITSIDDETFYECRASEVILPYSLTHIGGAAFRCSNIRELYMPDSVVSVGGSAFSDCYYLKKIRLSENLKILSAGIFEYSGYIQELIIPDGVEKICKDALSKMRFLKKLVIGRGVRSMDKSYMDAVSLREIQNHSTLNFSLKEFGIETNLVKWKVDGVKKDVVEAGKTAFGKGKEYKLVYKYMNGVTCQGKRPKTYEYGIHAKMPAAKKKGYVFFGWNWNETRFAKSKSWIQCFNYVPDGAKDTGAIVVMPRFLKVSVKKKSRDRFTITADASGARCILDGIGVRYSTDPSMKNSKIKRQYFLVKPKGYKKKFTIKAKKGKKYYIQFALYDGEYVYKGNDMWSKSKVYKMG